MPSQGQKASKGKVRIGILQMCFQRLRIKKLAFKGAVFIVNENERTNLLKTKEIFRVLALLVTGFLEFMKHPGTPC